MPRGEWETRQLQAVLFLKKALPPTDIFSALAGTAPDSQEDRPKEGVRVQTGTMGDQVLQVVVSPSRVDIVRAAAVGAGTLAGAPVLGNFKAETEKFTAMLIDWLPQCDFPILRLALVVTALAPADSVIGAYEILKENLTSVRVQPGEMRDLMFRVNWKAATANTAEGYLNRLTTWTAIRFGARMLVPGGPEFAEVEKHYAQREIDVNTPEGHSEELPIPALVTIFSELSQLALRTAEAGEGP